jgi:hypothetical protein
MKFSNLRIETVANGYIVFRDLSHASLQVNYREMFVFGNLYELAEWIKYNIVDITAVESEK